MRIGNDTISVSTTDLSQAVQSDAIPLMHICNFAVQLVFTGAPVGTFYLQCSNDKTNTAADVVNWTTITTSLQSITEAGNHMWNVSNCGYRWMRFAFTPISGSGTITSAIFSTKGV